MISLENELGGGPEGLDQSRVRDIKDQRVSDREERWFHMALRLPMRRTAWDLGRAWDLSDVSQKRWEVHETWSGVCEGDRDSR